uniref:Uncharacterized protein n=1 Tax=Zea mays TaxID=4577 RepID=C0P952_MAIZE|nr:unknown [Zea mays]
MRRLTPAYVTLILDHVLGDPSIPTAAAIALIAGLPSPSDPTPRLRRGVLLRRLAADPVSESSLETLHLLASLPPCASPIAAAHIAVAAFLAASAPDFDAVARALFARPDGRARQAVHGGGSPALASDDAIVTVDQFEAAVGKSSSQTILRGLWGNRAAVEERVQELLAAEWAAIGPSRLEALAMRIVGDGAVETWAAADEAMRANLRILAGEEKTREILDKLEKSTCSTNPISTPAVEKVMNALKASCADLHSIVEDPLPAAKAVADELLAARMEKRVSLNAEVGGQPTTCGAAGPSIHNDKDNGPGIGKPHSLMERNATARTSQWEESHGLDGSEPPSPPRPRLPSPRRLPPSPLPPPGNKNTKRRKTRRWSLFEEETLRKGVEEYVTLS